MEEQSENESARGILIRNRQGDPPILVLSSFPEMDRNGVEVSRGVS